MKKKKLFTGINIQFPISELILNGEKTIETRTYPLPKKFEGIPLLIVETPGRIGNFKARIRGIVTFSGSFKYKNKSEFYADSKKHCVTDESPWKWLDKPKWGWLIANVKKFSKPIKCSQKRGIVYTNKISLDINCSSD